VDFCEIIVKMTTNSSRHRGNNGNDHKDVCKIAILGCAGVGKTVQEFKKLHVKHQINLQK
jgi:hypothetical protein